jgi:zinc transport system ATP-binding protein
MSDLPVIEASGINVTFSGKPVLQDVSLNVKKGDFIGMIGPNGGGKTTLLKVILGLIKPDSGTVTIHAHSHGHGRCCLGYVPQYAKFDRSFPMTAYDMVLTGRLSHRKIIGRYSEKDHDKAITAMKRLRVEHLKDKAIRALSGGQLQRVLVARAIASHTVALLLDEPTSMADPKAERDFYDILKEINEKIPIVMVSHDIGVISKFINKIACLNQTLHYHEDKQIDHEMLESLYHCPVEMIAHHVPHRLLHAHDDSGDSHD